MTISFRFVERIAVNELASECGTFQIVSKRADGDGHTSYGRFHTYARRTDERSETPEEEYLAAVGVDDVEAFSAQVGSA